MLVCVHVHCMYAMQNFSHKMHNIVIRMRMQYTHCEDSLWLGVDMLILDLH